MPTPRPAKPLAATELAVTPGVAGESVPSGVSIKLEPADPTHPGTLAPGTIIAERYRVDALLGEGGMGKVYAAEHVHMHKQVAIKVLHPEMSSTHEVVARFEREAVAAGKIAHPNVAAATDFGRLSDSSFFLVLEHVAGTDLRAAIRGGAMPPSRALHIVGQIAAAVGAAHAAGVVHRDLKPENIMLVDRDGDPDFVKVLDFGIAKIDSIGISDPSAPPSRPSRADGAPQPLTKMGAVFGTPDYMSPEQALGQAVDLRSDLYSIGVIFFELLTGQRPFQGGAVTLMRAHVLEAAPSLPVEVAGSLGPGFDAVLQRLLQKSAADRYASAGELLDALAELPSDTAEGVPEVMPVPVPSGDGVAAPAASGSIASLGTIDTVSAVSPTRRRRAFGPLSWLVLVAGGGGLAYVLATSPSAVFGALRDLGQDRAPPATAGPVAPAYAAGSAEVAAHPVPAAVPALDTASAPQAIDQALPAEGDDTAAAPDDTGSAAAPSRPGGRFVQGRPTMKPIHKASKGPAPPPRRPYIPPPSQWFKN